MKEMIGPNFNYFLRGRRCVLLMVKVKWCHS